MKNLSYKNSALLLIAVGILMSLFSTAFHTQWLFPEADLFLVDHNDPTRSYISKILSPHKHDAEQYQGRELSYVFENLDARFIHWCVMELGYAHFFSITTYILFILTSLIVWLLAKRFEYEPLQCLLVGSLLWISPYIFWGGIYIRDAKVLCMFFLALFIYGRYKQWHWSVMISIAVLGNLSDLQFGPLSLLLAAIWFRINKQHLIIISSIGLVIHKFWMYGIGPILVQKFTPWKVKFDYLSIPWKDLSLTKIWEAFSLTVDTVNFSIGMVGMLYVIVRGFIQRDKTDKLHIALMFGGLMLLNLAMILRHPPLTWLDARHVFYYWQPTTIVVLYIVAMTVRILEREQYITATLVAILISGLIYLPQHKEFLTNGHLRGFQLVNPNLLNTLEDGRLAMSTNQTHVSYDFERGRNITGFEDVYRCLSVDGRTIDGDATISTSHYLRFVLYSRAVYQNSVVYTNK